VLAVWEGLEKQSLWNEMIAVEMRHMGALGVPTSDLGVPFSLGDGAELRRLLDAAGFRDVDVASKTIEADFPADGLVEYSLRAYTAVMPHVANDAAAFRAFVEAVARDTEEVRARHTRDGRLRFAMHTSVAVARS
jgi:hypothetical protein